MGVRTSTMRLRAFRVGPVCGSSTPAAVSAAAGPVIDELVKAHRWTLERTLFVQYACGCIVCWRADGQDPSRMRPEIAAAVRANVSLPVLQ